MNGETRKILVIVNAASGRSRSDLTALKLCDELRKSGADVRAVLTTGIADAREIAATEGRNYDLVVACGGDGTLSEVISGLVRLESPPPVGFFPVGSTCDIAQTFGFSSDPVKSAHDLLSGISYAIDIGSIRGDRSVERKDLPQNILPDDPDKLPHHFTYIASFGAFTETSYATRRVLKKTLGHFAYVLTGIKALRRIRVTPTSLFLDGEDCSSDYIFGGMVNSFSVGGIVKLGDVSLNDGYFETVLIKNPGNIVRTLLLLSHLLNGKEDINIIRKRARKAIFTFNEPEAFTVDGEYGGTRKTWEIRNLNRAISLRIPKLPPSPKKFE